MLTMDDQPLSIYPASENSLLITWPEKICPTQHQKILNLAQQINANFGQFIDETIVSYNALLIYYHFDKITTAQLEQHLHTLWLEIENDENQRLLQPRTIEIPVYYGAEVALDIDHVAKQCQLSTAEVINLHSQRKYHAYALGFTPGFCYLGQLPDALVLSRKSTPRLTVARGAVAIAEQQTAVYPNISPGGWQIIGQTPAAMYQVNNNDFTPAIAVGDLVQFVPITKTEFITLGGTLE